MDIYIRKDFADSPFTINHEKKMQIFEPRVNNGRYIAGRQEAGDRDLKRSTLAVAVVALSYTPLCLRKSNLDSPQDSIMVLK